MTKLPKDWIALRDGLRPPNSEEELLTLIAFELNNHVAMEEQAYAQRRLPSLDEMQRLRLKTAAKIYDMCLSGFDCTEEGETP